MFALARFIGLRGLAAHSPENMLAGVRRAVELPPSLKMLLLPSTSAANARMSFVEKLLAGRQIEPFLLKPIS